MADFQPGDRNYSSWSWSDDIAHDRCDPVTERLLVGDSLTADGEVRHTSPYRTCEAIPGVLVLDGSTYGRHGSRMLYKCVPSDPLLPAFMVPYVTKSVEFSKRKVNKYVLFRFLDWEDKHPLGILAQSIGNVDELGAFYQFQLYARGVHYSVQPLAKHVKRSLPVTIDESAMEDRRTWSTIAIDPAGCTDFDDALGFRRLENGRALVSVYIANVPVWLEALSAWAHLSEQAATVYLPDGKRSMLPSILSEKLCSLRAGEDKYVLAMDVELDGGEVVAVRFGACVVRIRRNYVYDEPELLADPTYRALFEATKAVARHRRCVEKVEDSHDVVEVLMVAMNHEASKVLYGARRGIFRDVRVDAAIPLPEHDLMRVWRHTKGSYVVAEDHVGHQMMGLETYVQVTSPIRRRFDLVNMVELSEVCGFTPRSEAMGAFVDQTVASLDRLNDIMKRIKRVQNDCALLEYCHLRELDEPLVAHTLDERDALYIPALHTVVRCESTEALPPYTEVRVRLYVFTDEATLWRKVRIQVEN